MMKNSSWRLIAYLKIQIKSCISSRFQDRIINYTQFEEQMRKKE
jgi:hypothetical protein